MWGPSAIVGIGTHTSMGMGEAGFGPISSDWAYNF